MDKITLVIPCYNEEESLPFLEKELEKLLKKMNNVQFEIIMIDNCSEDNTLKIMKKLHKQDNKYQFISFSRNFGKEASIYAGLKASTGDYVAIMDADLQDPPELLFDMYHILKNEDYDSVATYRSNRKREPIIKSIFARLFYRIMNNVSSYKMVSGARDYRLMTRKMVDAILMLEESERFTKGIFAWVGFKTKWLPFSNHERVAGKTKFPIKSAISCALGAIVSFSTIPLSMILVFGIIFCLGSLVYLVYSIISHSINNSYSLIIFIMLIGFGINFSFLGILGQYISQIGVEVRKRPKYIIKECSKNIRK